MGVRDRPRLASLTWSALVALVLACTLVVIVVALREDGGFGADEVRDLAVPMLFLLALATLVAVWAWRQDMRAAGALLEAERHARARVAEEEGEARRAAVEKEEDAERLAAEARDELQAAQAAKTRLETLRASERKWADQLRDRVHELHREGGTFADGDVRDLVLRTAMALVDAERGVLLERAGPDLDGDGDTALRVGAHAGFDGKGALTDLADDLAHRVLRRDETLRDDHPPEGRGVDCLVALPVYVAGEFSGVVVLADRPGGFAEVEDDLLLSLGDHAGSLLSSSRLRGDLRAAYLATVSLLAAALEVKDPFVRSHCDDVATLVSVVADRLGVPAERREALVFASLLHDIGKLGISERILLKPERLTPEERAVIELHPRIGFRLVEQVPALRPIAPAVLHHHERWDGTGYPVGLAGTQIPLEARIVGVADAFSAMTGERPYSSPMAPEEACEELVRGAGSHFDPDVVEAFVTALREHGPYASPRAALSDPEIDALRSADEPLLGSGAAAVIDPTTLLYSHRHLQETAAAEGRRAALQERPFTVAVVALTDLARTNREKGYAIGDEDLRSVARVLSAEAARRPGAVAGRLGGAKLALLVPGVAPDLEAALAAALSAERAVRLGVAGWEPGEDGEAVVARAASAASVPAAA